MSALNILILCHNFQHHGSYFRAQKTAEFFAERGHDVTFMHCGEKRVFSTYLDPQQDNLLRIETPNFTWLHNPQEGWSAVDWFTRLGQVNSKEYDLILAYSHKPSVRLPARFCRFRYKSFLVADWCDLWSGRYGLIKRVILPGQDYRQRWFFKRWARRAAFAFESFEEKRFCRRSNATTVISSWLRDRAIESNVPEDRVEVIYSGCDTRRIMPQNRIHCLKDLELDLNDSFLGYIGNVHPDEDMLLKAFARVCENTRNVRLLVAGAPFSANIRSAYGNQVAARITHLGRVPFSRITRILGACDILLLPMENSVINKARLPHKFTDYLAAGRPIASTDVGDTANFFKRHELGMLTAAKAEDYAEGILKLLEQSDRWQRYGAYSRLLAEGELSWKTQLAKLESFLINLNVLTKPHDAKTA